MLIDQDNWLAIPDAKELNIVMAGAELTQQPELTEHLRVQQGITRAWLQDAAYREATNELLYNDRLRKIVEKESHLAEKAHRYKNPGFHLEFYAERLTKVVLPHLVVPVAPEFTSGILESVNAIARLSRTEAALKMVSRPLARRMLRGYAASMPTSYVPLQRNPFLSIDTSKR